MRCWIPESVVEILSRHGITVECDNASISERLKPLRTIAADGSPNRPVQLRDKKYYYSNLIFDANYSNLECRLGINICAEKLTQNLSVIGNSLR